MSKHPRACRAQMPDTTANRIVLIVLARLLSYLDGSKTGMTYKTISSAFDHQNGQFRLNSKNLTKTIFQQIKEPLLRTRCLRLASHIFDFKVD